MSDNILPAFYANYMRNGKVKSWSEIMVRSNFYFGSLNHFQWIFHFSTHWKHRKSSNFLMFSGRIEVEHWLKMGLFSWEFPILPTLPSYEKQIKVFSLWISKKQLVLHHIVSLYYHKSSGISGRNRGQIKKPCGRGCKTR